MAHTEEALQRATAEAINLAAYSAGGAHRAGKARRVDCFHMHNVNASIFTAFNRLPWLSLADKVRLIERKARLNLGWYAASSAPELRVEYCLMERERDSLIYPKSQAQGQTPCPSSLQGLWPPTPTTDGCSICMF